MWEGKGGVVDAFLFNLGLLSSNKEIILSEQPFLYSNGGAATESRSVSWYDKGIKNISVSLFFGPSSPYFRMFLSFVSVLKHKCTLEKKMPPVITLWLATREERQWTFDGYNSLFLGLNFENGPFSEIIDLATESFLVLWSCSNAMYLLCILYDDEAA